MLAPGDFGMLLLVLRGLDDGLAIVAERGRGSVRLREADSPWNDELLDLRCELADDGLVAVNWVRTLNDDGLVAWAAGLAESFRGWDGVRAWESFEHDPRVEAVHDGLGNVALRFIIRGPRGYEPNAWEASTTMTLDSGEDMRELAAALSDLVS